MFSLGSLFIYSYTDFETHAGGHNDLGKVFSITAATAAKQQIIMYLRIRWRCVNDGGGDGSRNTVGQRTGRRRQTLGIVIW